MDSTSVAPPWIALAFIAIVVLLALIIAWYFFRSPVKELERELAKRDERRKARRRKMDRKLAESEQQPRQPSKQTGGETFFQDSVPDDILLQETAAAFAWNAAQNTAAAMVRPTAEVQEGFLPVRNAVPASDDSSSDMDEEKPKEKKDTPVGNSDDANSKDGNNTPVVDADEE